MINIVDKDRVKFSMVKNVANLFFTPKNEIHYIGGTDILPPPLEIEEEKELVEKLGKVDDTEVKSILIERNLRLVVYIAKNSITQALVLKT